MRPAFVALVLAVSHVAQQPPQQPFSLDAKRPYVYLQFDHVGQRKPLGPDESDRGLWLRFVNNCRLPVAIWTSNAETGDSGISVEDEVVPVSGPSGVRSPEAMSSPITTTLIPPRRGTEAQQGERPNQPATSAQARATPVGSAPGETAPGPEAAFAPTEQPIGYGFEIGTFRTIKPGDSVLFSVPFEHVSPRWYLRVRFTLVVSPPVRGDEEPYSYVNFSWRDIPQKVRGRK